jgi:cytochrome c-type biogenesis protein CcmH
MRVLILLLALLWSAPAFAVGADETMLSDPAQETRARQLMEDLRCLVCQNQSISDSNADLARDLRVVVRERIAAGDDDRQVRQFMVTRYGDWILMKPPFNLRTALLWLAPVLLLLAGGFGAWAFIRRQRPASAPERLDADEQARLDALLSRDR